MIRRGWVSVLLVAATMGASASAPAAAAPPPPTDLHVVDGSERWRPYRDFQLAWKIPTGVTPPVAAAHYRLKAPGGMLIREATLGKVETVTVRVSAVPGIYTGEVWLEDGEGAEGAPDVTQLRYDDARPQAATPQAEPDWLSRNAFPYTLRIEHPGDPIPPSGIQGYAVSVDPSPTGDPCVDSLLCSELETDLHGGIGADSLEIFELPDGENYVHTLAVSGSGVHSAVARKTLLRVDTGDPRTRLEGVSGGWTNRSVTLSARASDAESGMEGGFTAIRVDDGAPDIAAGDEVESAVISEGVHEVAYYARDAAGNVNDGATTNGVANNPPGTATVRIDRTPPHVAFHNSLDPEDPERIRARVEDALSGGSSDLGSIGFRVAGSGDPFQPLPTRASRDALVAGWDSDAYSPGRYEFRATAFDEAGNVAATTSQADGAAMILSNPIKAPTVLAARLDGRGRPLARTVAYGRPVRLSGRLTTGSRRPIAGAPIQVSERYVGVPHPRLRTVATDANGRFSLRLPVGPSRVLIASYPGSRAFSSSSSERFDLGVRSGVALRVSSPLATVGGSPVLFSGLVRAARGELPPGGKSIELQFRAAGLPWQEFRTIYADRRGRFRYAYRFSDDDSRGVRFEFRAVAAAQQGWPYEPGGSTPVVVRGR